MDNIGPQNHFSGVRSGIGSNTRFFWTVGSFRVFNCPVMKKNKKIILQELKYNFVGLYFQ